MADWEANVRRVVPYTPGEQPKRNDIIKLNTNECPYPPSPKVAEAILAGYEEIAAGCGTAGAAGRAEKADCGCDAGATEAGKMAEKAAQIMPPELANLRLYSDPEERVLIEAIAAHYGVGTNQVIAGNGSDEILGFAFRAFCDSEAPLQFADLTYGFYPALCGLYGIPFRVVPLEEDFTLNIEPYKNCGNNVIIANPNAPTGHVQYTAQTIPLNPPLRRGTCSGRPVRQGAVLPLDAAHTRVLSRIFRHLKNPPLPRWIF